MQQTTKSWLLPISIALTLIVVGILARNGLQNEPPALAQGPTAETGQVYAFAVASRDGTGKFYQGREIAQVMGHQGLFWLEREQRESEEGVQRVMELLELNTSDVVADIGAGSGYYAFRLAKLVPDGEVLGVDIQPEMLEFLDRRAKELGVENVRSHLGTVESIQLPPGSIDAVFIVDAYHEFSHPKEMLESISSALRSKGRLILLEYRGEDESVPIKPLHKMTEAQAIREVELSGLQWQSTDSSLPWQHFMVFVKP